ncbi:MAG: hypothetical protein LBK25_07500 [Treponema sp.]|nr:hypothetical protein [Treponema sp.]
MSDERKDGRWYQTRVETAVARRGVRGTVAHGAVSGTRRRRARRCQTCGGVRHRRRGGVVSDVRWQTCVGTAVARRGVRGVGTAAHWRAAARRGRGEAWT